MKNKKIALSLLLLGMMLNMSCSTAQSSVRIEKGIIEEIFSEIFEYAFQDFRKLIPPLPPPPAPRWTDEEWDQHFENYKKHLDSLKFAPLYVIVNDSAYGIPKSELKRIYNENNQRIKNIDTSIVKKSFKLDLSKLDLGKDYIIKYKSDFSNTIDELIREEWRKHPREEIHLHQFSGIISLSRIYFNSEQNYGFLNVSFGCGKLCGCDYRFFIKKVADKWVIDKIDDLGCA